MWITTIEGKLLNLAQVEQIVHQAGKMIAILSGGGGERHVTVLAADVDKGLHALADAISSGSEHTDLRNL